MALKLDIVPRGDTQKKCYIPFIKFSQRSCKKRDRRLYFRKCKGILPSGDIVSISSLKFTRFMSRAKVNV